MVAKLVLTQAFWGMLPPAAQVVLLQGVQPILLAAQAALVFRLGLAEKVVRVAILRLVSTHLHPAA
jgi:hypothetical protein